MCVLNVKLVNSTTVDNCGVISATSRRLTPNTAEQLTQKNDNDVCFLDDDSVQHCHSFTYSVSLQTDATRTKFVDKLSWCLTQTHCSVAFCCTMIRLLWFCLSVHPVYFIFLFVSMCKYNNCSTAEQCYLADHRIIYYLLSPSRSSDQRRSFYIHT